MKNKLKFIIFALVISTIQPAIFAQKGKSKSAKIYNAPFGVQGWTFRKQFPADGAVSTLNLIQKMGITELESGAAKGTTNEEFKKLCDDRGITIPSTGSSFEELEKDPQKIIKNAKELGSTFVMCAWIPHKGNNFTIDDAKKAVEVFNSAGKTLKENGITFCYHPHGFEFRPYENGTLLDYIFQNTNPENVSFEMDVLWVLHGGGNPVQLLEKYGSRWKLMHVKDLKKGVIGDFSGGTPAENDVVLGTGQADWKNIFRVSKKIGIKHYFIEDESEREVENVPLSIDYLKNLR